MIFHSDFESVYLWLPIFGFIIGFFGSLIGGGGGFFFLPVLTIFFGVPAQVAVTTSLAATIPVCVVGSISHRKRKNLDMKIGLIFALGGIIGAFGGAAFTSMLTTKQLKVSFGIYSILMALHIILKTRTKKKKEAQGGKLEELSPRSKFASSSIYGILSGIVTGSFGTSGTAPVLAGLFAIRMPLKLVVGTSLLIAGFNTISALGAHFLVGMIDLTLVYLLTFGTMIGAFIGPKFLSGYDIQKAENPVREWYSVGMIIFGIAMMIV